MRKKTIGEVLRLARVNQGLTLEELQRKTGIQLEMLDAMEKDHFDLLPGAFSTRTFLRKYAWAVELDEQIVLEAYDAGERITYEEIDVDEKDLVGRRRTTKKKTSFLPLFYFVLVALSILIFVTYYVWNYLQTQPASPAPSSYSVVSVTSSTSLSSSTSSSSSSSQESVLAVSGGGSNLEARLTTSKESLDIQLSVTDVTSWVSVSDSDLSGGVTLSAENNRASATVSTKNPVTITLGVVKGVSIMVDNQRLDTSALTSQTGRITLTFTTN